MSSLEEKEGNPMQQLTTLLRASIHSLRSLFAGNEHFDLGLQDTVPSLACSRPIHIPIVLMNLKGSSAPFPCIVVQKSAAVTNLQSQGECVHTFLAYNPNKSIVLYPVTPNVATCIPSVRYAVEVFIIGKQISKCPG